MPGDTATGSSSLNRDLPYDRFVSLQLAGDELAPDDPDALIATGFNRCYPDMVDLNDQGLRRQNALNDITETAGLVFLGLTIGCARCHDHKFDPIRQADFYRLQAFFTPARFRDDVPLTRAPERRRHEQAVAAWEGEVAAIQAEILRIEKPVRDRLAPGLPMGALDEAVAAYNKPESLRRPAEVKLVYELLSRDGRIKARDWPGLLGERTTANRGQLLARLEQTAKRRPPSPPTARAVDEAGPERLRPTSSCAASSPPAAPRSSPPSRPCWRAMPLRSGPASDVDRTPQGARRLADPPTIP